MKKYICIETSQVLTYGECQIVYEKDIYKSEYPSFSCWWEDMKKNGILIEVNVIKEINLENEMCYIFKNNNGNYEIYFSNSDYTVVGTLEDIKEEFFYHTNKELIL